MLIRSCILPQASEASSMIRLLVKVSALSQICDDCKLAIHGLDPGIPAGMTAQRMLQCVLAIPAGKIH